MLTFLHTQPEQSISLIKRLARFSKFGLVVLAFLGASFSAQAQLLDPFYAKYVAYRNGSEIGFAELELNKLADSKFKLRFYSDASLFLIYDKREEISEFIIQDNKLTPVKYAFTKKGTFKDSNLNASFDASQSKVKMDNKPDLAWQGELDNQLYRLSAQKMLSQGKTEFDFDLINYRGEKKHYAFKVEGEETLTLPFGELKALKVKTIRQNSSRVTYSWFAPKLNYLMVRLQQFKDGNEQGDIQLSTFTQNK
ncbi:DUF3108 domain-containing protein [Alteromonas sp. a30]|uniref:DUF3108 domain-containing protein n=1 Tax=Alteromonas sp. a30 TaxID=2730917 RepID=UPI0022813631|nr:DUF3108 domain-containing protein [Alteromonas sp. a30]MCY7294112.1 DUF3108 domain-containing protein [Alteromonas sp. a30]